jgi:hypothetical protein
MKKLKAGSYKQPAFKNLNKTMKTNTIKQDIFRYPSKFTQVGTQPA